MQLRSPLPTILCLGFVLAACANREAQIAEPPTGAPTALSASLDPDSVAVVLPAGDSSAGRQAFLDHDCGSCHRVSCDPDFQSRGTSGAPELDAARLRAQGFGTVASSIIAPSHRLAPIDDPTDADPESAIAEPGDMARTEMPLFNDSLTVAEWINLVHFLLAEGDCLGA